MKSGRAERLSQIIKKLNITKFSFASQCKIAPSNFNMMLEDKQTITDKTLKKIVTAFPELNMNWLKTGEGEMLLPTSSESTAVVGCTSESNLIKELITEIRNQNQLTERAMSQTDKTIDMLSKTISLLEKTVDRSC